MFIEGFLFVINSKYLELFFNSIEELKVTSQDDTVLLLFEGLLFCLKSFF